MDTVRDANVELMDPVGGSSETDKSLTDQDGRVDFNTVTGQHRIRITADGAIPYEGDFQIGEAETFHAETFRLRRKPDAQQSAVDTKNAGTATVPLVRLKVPDKARKEFERGSKALEQKNWADARKNFQAAIEHYSDYDLAYNGLGVASTELKDKPAALQAFHKAIGLNDKFAEAQRNLARILLSDHDFEQVAALLEQSLVSEPNNAWALTNAAYAELELHRFKQAAEHALQVHALPHQRLANAHVIAAYALQELGEPQQAAEQWKLYLKEDPSGPNARRAQDEISRLTKPSQS